jgi:hypothetical protein
MNFNRTRNAIPIQFVTNQATLLCEKKYRAKVKQGADIGVAGD